MKNKDRKTILVKYINYNGNYDVESKKVTEIWEDKFNSKYHKKLFCRNLIRKINESIKKINWMNPWIITIGGGLLVGITLMLLK